MIHNQHCRLFVMLKLLVVLEPEQKKYNLEDIRSALEQFQISNSQITVYTRSIETRRYKSKIKIGIRLRSCTNLSGRK